MRRKLTIMTTALTGLLIGLAVPATMAQSKTEARAPIASFSGEAFDGRPMDDHSDVTYGDLSVFDTIHRIGDAQESDEPYCDIRATLIRTLDHDFAEKPKVRSPLSQHRSVELYASDIMGTWTAVYTRADGIACVVSSGIGWTRGDNPVALLETESVLPQS